jgi:capsular polysaccharide biosynthesis protein
MQTSLIKILKKGWWILVLTTAVAIVTVVAYSRLTYEVRYDSSLRVVVSPSVEISDEGDLIRMLDSLSRGDIIPTFTEMFQSKQVLEDAFETIGLTDNREAYQVNAYNLPETNILVLSVTGPDRVNTFELAREVSFKAQELIIEIYPLYTITTLEAPDIPRTEVGQSQQRNIAMSVFLGLGLGLALSFLVYGDLDEILGRSK